MLVGQDQHFPDGYERRRKAMGGRAYWRLFE